MAGSSVRSWPTRPALAGSRSSAQTTRRSVTSSSKRTGSPSAASTTRPTSTRTSRWRRRRRSNSEVEVAGGDAGVAGVPDGGAHVAGDERLVHLVGAVDEPSRAGVLHHPLERRVGGVTEGAVHLDGAVHDLPEHVRHVML